MAVDDDFMISEQSDIFVNSAFGAIVSQTGTPLHFLPDGGHEEAFPVYPVAAPGVHLAWSAGGSVSWRMGLYHGGPGRDIERNRGFDWGKFPDAGVLIFAEISRDLPIAGMPSTVKAGVSGHTGRFDNFAALNADDGRAHYRARSFWYSCLARHDRRKTSRRRAEGWDVLAHGMESATRPDSRDPVCGCRDQPFRPPAGQGRRHRRRRDFVFTLWPRPPRPQQSGRPGKNANCRRVQPTRCFRTMPSKALFHEICGLIRLIRGQKHISKVWFRLRWVICGCFQIFPVKF